MQTLANLIIRPKRDLYEAINLYPFCFTLNEKNYYRKDVTLQGKRGKLICSWYEELQNPSTTCIVYCHGNSGSRLDSEEILEYTLKAGYSLFCFDFSGCGLSDGEYISLGHYEKEDIGTVVKYIYSINHNIDIILWGRSMGAVACILYCYLNPFIVTLVLDSPFADFKQVIDEMIEGYIIVPKFLRDFIYNLTAEHVQKIIDFDIRELSPKKFIKNCKIPTIFIHSGQDRLVNIQHSKELYKEFKGPKCFIEIHGEHNTVRDPGVVGKTLKIIRFLLLKRSSEEQETTIREKKPEFQKNLAEIIRHRRYFSQGYN